MADDPLQLGQMARRQPPAGLWRAIEADLAARRSARRRRMGSLGALAAGLAALVVTVAVLRDAPLPDETASVSPALAEARTASARLEAQLAARRPGVIDSTSLASLMWLETELEWLDQQLTESPDDVDLWRQRVDLLAELNRYYAAGDWRLQVTMASL